MRSPVYADRHEAGVRLAHALPEVVGADAVVLGVARGGVPVAAPVAAALVAPLDVVVVRKLGTPGQEELAMGAIASGGVLVRNPSVLAALADPEEALRWAVRRELPELHRRERLYRGDRPALAVDGRTAVLVDDGLATGATMRAAIESVRHRRAARIVVAVPVAAASVCEDLRAEVDAVVCLLTPEWFRAVGAWYDRFTQTSDDEVRALLRPPPGPEAHPGGGP